MKHYHKRSYYYSAEKIIKHYINKELWIASTKEGILLVNTPEDCFYLDNTLFEVQSIIDAYNLSKQERVN